jgi:prepilin-type processing-associated H-X9-DG protein
MATTCSGQEIARMRKTLVSAMVVCFVIAVLSYVFVGHMEEFVIAGAIGIALLAILLTLYIADNLLGREDEISHGYARASRNLGLIALWPALGFMLVFCLFLTGLIDFFELGLLVIEFFLFCWTICLAAATVVCSVAKRNSTEGGGVGRAVVAVAILFLTCVFLFIALARPISSPRQDSCQNNLKQMGLVLRMFANENKGNFYPHLSAQAGCLSLLNASEKYTDPVYPEYLTDPNILFCPDGDPKDAEVIRAAGGEQAMLDASSYMYLGYAVTNDAELEAFANAYRERIAKGLPFDEDLTVSSGTGNNGSEKIYRLREGVERVFTTAATTPAATAKAQSLIPMLIEHLGNHKPKGINVLYMDGHVEFLRYPGKWPATEKTFAILLSIESLNPTKDTN